MWEIISSTISILNSIGVGVIANYISRNLDKWLDGRSANKKH